MHGSYIQELVADGEVCLHASYESGQMRFIHVVREKAGNCVTLRPAVLSDCLLVP